VNFWHDPSRSIDLDWVFFEIRLISDRLKVDNCNLHWYLVPAFLRDAPLGAVITRLFSIALLLASVTLGA
jgi:hypothetical protein